MSYIFDRIVTLCAIILTSVSYVKIVVRLKYKNEEFMLNEDLPLVYLIEFQVRFTIQTRFDEWNIREKGIIKINIIQEC